jgi:hypothetical protein
MYGGRERDRGEGEEKEEEQKLSATISLGKQGSNSISPL